MTSTPGSSPPPSPTCPIILQLIRELAEFERLSHEVVATEELAAAEPVGARPGAEV